MSFAPGGGIEPPLMLLLLSALQHRAALPGKKLAGRATGHLRAMPTTYNKFIVDTNVLVSAFTGGAFTLTGYLIGNLTAFVRMVALKPAIAFWWKPPEPHGGGG